MKGVRPVGARPVLRLLARGVLAFLVVGALSIGVALLLAQRSASADRSAYNTLPRCPAGTPPAAAGCWAWQSGRITAVTQSFTALGARRDLVSFQTAQLAGTVPVEATAVYYCTGPGDPTVLKFWKGNLTGLYTPHGVLLTAGNPNVGPSDHLEAGVLLISAALIVPVAALVARRRPAGSSRSAVRAFFADRLVRFALVLFGIGQLADVVTSALGQRNGLLEGNALVADVINVAGPMGFLLVRLPIVALAVIGIMRMPRLVAVGVLVGVGAYFIGVGGHNLQLALAATSPAVCPSFPLP